MMPHIIPICDLENAAAISQMSINNCEGKMLMTDVYSKLAEAETEIMEGKVSEAREALNILREKLTI